MLTCTCSCNRGSSAWQTPRTSIAQTNLISQKRQYLNPIFQENILRRIHFHVANAYHEDSCSAPHCLSHQKFTMTIFDQVEKFTKCWIFRLTCGLWIMTICYLYKAILKGHKILMRRKAFHCCKVPCMKVIVFSQTRNYITWNHQIAYTCLFT